MSNTTEQPSLVGQVEPTVMQHTPGPWVTYGHRKLFVMSEFTAIEIGGVNRFEANAEANACLIAAAPDLLDCLQEAIEDSEEVLAARISSLGERYRQDRLKAMRAQITQARAAIAKAVGAA